MAENKPQRQDSLEDQLKDLAALADREGMYDAADFIRFVTARPTPERSNGR